MMREIFESALRSSGDIAGVFEFDGQTSYFYLYRIDASAGNKVIDAIRISEGGQSSAPIDVSVRWSGDENIVGLQIGDQIWAYFDCLGAKQSGSMYLRGGQTQVPLDIRMKFLSN
jgi:hypothetical protein